MTDAKRWQIQTTAAIREGRHFTMVEAKKHTQADLIDRYIADVLPQKPRSIADRTRQLSWWKEQIGSYALADITPSLIARHRDELARETTSKGTERSPATVVRYMAALSHVFTIAVKDWEWLDDNPMRKVTKPREPRGRMRFLSDDERQRLLEECKKSNLAVHPITVMAIYTGMRRSEILDLVWADVDLERGRVILHKTKNDERRQVPLAGPALEVILFSPRRAQSCAAIPRETKKSLTPAPLRLSAHLRRKGKLTALVDRAEGYPAENGYWTSWQIPAHHPASGRSPAAPSSCLLVTPPRTSPEASGRKPPSRPDALQHP